MSINKSPSYTLRAEQEYCSHPRNCRRPDVLILGSATGLSSAQYLLSEWQRLRGEPLRIVVCDAGPFDLLTHTAHAPGIPRLPFVRGAIEHLGGRLTQWGLSAPRPPTDCLKRWPYEFTDLVRRFQAVETELAVPDPLPYSGLQLESRLRTLLRDCFPARVVRVAPLAIDRDGRRWCPLKYVPTLRAAGVQFLTQFRCTDLIAEDDQIVAVRGQWLDGRSYTVHPRIVVLAIGVEPSLSLVRQVIKGPLPLEVADHMRIDLHGRLPADAFGTQSIEEQGIAVLLMECQAKRTATPFHLEVKVATCGLWRRGAMQSSDNLRGEDSDDTLYVQVQAVAAMHDRLPTTDLLHVGSTLAPVMSARDAAFHGEIIQVMQEVAAALGLSAPVFCLRPLLTNHHAYGAYRVGSSVSPSFRFNGFENLYVLPPSAFVDCDDDANPTLKSLVLAQYAMDDIVENLEPACASKVESIA